MNHSSRCPACGRKFPLGLFGAPSGQCKQCHAEITMTYLRNATLNGSTVALVMLLPGALNLALSSVPLSIGVAWSTAALWFAMFPRRYRALPPADHSDS
jgi:hypothetical protein